MEGTSISARDKTESRNQCSRLGRRRGTEWYLGRIWHKFVAHLLKRLAVIDVKYLMADFDEINDTFLII